MKKKGFTLLELLVVIAIIAILSVVLIITLDPSEILKKARDSQRISDLNTMKTALGVYLTSYSSPNLDNGQGVCANNNATATIMYSVTGMGACSGGVATGTDFAGTAFLGAFCKSAAAGTNTAVDGTGWVPVNLTVLTGGAPISNLPLDPINTVATLTAPTKSDLVYRYGCQMLATPSGTKPVKAYEFDGILESATYGPGGSDDRSAKDGGDNPSYYEVGSSLRLIGSSTAF